MTRHLRQRSYEVTSPPGPVTRPVHERPTGRGPTRPGQDSTTTARQISPKPSPRPTRTPPSSLISPAARAEAVEGDAAPRHAPVPVPPNPGTRSVPGSMRRSSRPRPARAGSHPAHHHLAHPPRPRPTRARSHPPSTPMGEDAPPLPHAPPTGVVDDPRHAPPPIRPKAERRAGAPSARGPHPRTAPEARPRTRPHGEPPVRTDVDAELDRSRRGRTERPLRSLAISLSCNAHVTHVFA